METAGVTVDVDKLLHYGDLLKVRTLCTECNSLLCTSIDQNFPSGRAHL